MLIYAIKTIELVLDLYQIAAQITFDLPAILVVSIMVSGEFPGPRIISHSTLFQGFIAGFIGLLVTLVMLGIVAAARLENDANPQGTNQTRVGLIEMI